MAYKHGAYGERVSSKTRSASQVEENLVYFGVAPINLIRGYDDAGLINTPVRLRNLGEAQSKIGYSENWDSFSLCEVVDYHFNNTDATISRHIPHGAIMLCGLSIHRGCSRFLSASQSILCELLD